ncbi:MAG: hypothetical protein M3238_04335, partial [Actinomycetota bacterium]|nr:hypothetical protein [Actinomycetota bacterium]
MSPGLTMKEAGGMRRFSAASGVVLVFPLFLQIPAAAAPTCLGRPATIVGTKGHDVLRGTDGPDVITGLGGADVIRGGGGDDFLCGGSGDYYGEYRPEVVNGGEGSDTLAGGKGWEKLAGGPGTDVLYLNLEGGSANGGLDDDSLVGGPDADYLGGAVLDRTTFDFGPEINVGSAQSLGEPGIDTIFGNGGDDTLFIGPGDETMDGGDGRDHVSFYSTETQEYS